ncbi:MAG: NTP transferase domain-containing protein [Roseiflexaceae bacterium]|nr:NTP transferase domain-containing protein [Roseiflexaceae bacterium]
MSNTVRQGVVLAAGRGTRMHALSNSFPKPLQPICNKPIMQYQIEAMRDAGISEIALVVGPNGQEIRSYFGTGGWLGVQLTYIEDGAPAGIAASLALTEPWIDGPFVVFLGDIFLALTDLSSALAPLDDGAAATIIVRRDLPEAVRRNFAVVTDAAGRISRVIEKPADPPTNLKGCGVYVFDQSIFDAIRRTPRSALRNEYEITDAVQILIDFGRPVFAADIVRWDINVTFPEDLLACNLRLLREQHRASLIGQGAHVGGQTRLANSIIGDQAVVAAPVLFEECLVLPGAHVAAREADAHRMIFGDGVRWAAQVAVGGELAERTVG